MNDYCKGCRTQIEIKSVSSMNHCIIITNAPNKKCPCKDCIVKLMCRSQCEEFIYTVRSIFNLPLSYDYKCVELDSLYHRRLNLIPYYKRL